MTVDELTFELSQLGEALSNPQELLSELGDDIVQRMKANVPVDTGRLRNSIRWSFAGDGLVISMLDYGEYQNYGVLPMMNPNPAKHKAFTNEFGTYKNPIPNPAGIYGRYSNRQFGLPSRQFYDELQITESIGIEFLDSLDI